MRITITAMAGMRVVNNDIKVGIFRPIINAKWDIKIKVNNET